MENRAGLFPTVLQVMRNYVGFGFYARERVRREQQAGAAGAKKLGPGVEKAAKSAAELVEAVAEELGGRVGGSSCSSGGESVGNKKSSTTQSKTTDVCTKDVSSSSSPSTAGGGSTNTTTRGAVGKDRTPSIDGTSTSGQDRSKNPAETTSPTTPAAESQNSEHSTWFEKAFAAEADVTLPQKYVRPGMRLEGRYFCTQGFTDASLKVDEVVPLAISGFEGENRLTSMQEVLVVCRRPRCSLHDPPKSRTISESYCA